MSTTAKTTFDILHSTARNAWIAIEIDEVYSSIFSPAHADRRDFSRSVEAPARALANSRKKRIRLLDRLGCVQSEIDANLSDYPRFETAAGAVSYLRDRGHRVTDITVEPALARLDNNHDRGSELAHAVA